MSIDFISSSQSAINDSTTSFSWKHPTKSTEKGILVFTFNNSSNDIVTGVTYGGQSLTAVSNGRAVNSSGSTKDCKAWFLGSNLSQTFSSANINELLIKQKSPAYIGKSLAYNNNQWLIGGVYNTYYTNESLENNNWTATNIGTADRVRYLDSKWLLCTYNGLKYSSNLTDFNNNTYSTASISSSLSVVDISFGNGTWVASIWDNSAQKYKIYSSTSLSGSWSVSNTVLDNQISSIVYNNGYWVLVSLTDIYYTTDPAGSWTIVQSSNVTNNTYYSNTYKRNLSLCNGYFIALSDYGYIYYASDPSSTWTGVNVSSNNYIGSNYGYARQLNDIAYGGGYYVAVGVYSQVFYATSVSGPWYKSTNYNFKTDDLLAIEYGNNQFYMIGWHYTSMYSNGLAKEIVVTQNSSSTSLDLSAAVAVSVSAESNPFIDNIILDQGNQVLNERNINDKNPGSASLRFGAINSGLSYEELGFKNTITNSLTTGSNSSYLNVLSGWDGISSNFQFALVKETNNGQGNRSVGFQSITSDDTAAVYLAIFDSATPKFSGWGIPIK